MKESRVNTRFNRVPHYDKETAEVELIDTIAESVEVGDFVKIMASKDMDKLVGYLGTAFTILYILFKHVKWETGYVTIGQPVKKDICDEVDLGEDMYEAHIRAFIKLNMMKRIARGQCMINPLMFFRGDRALQKDVAKKYHNAKSI